MKSRMKNRMKIGMMSLLIMLSLCVGFTACQTADVGGDILFTVRKKCMDGCRKVRV